MGMKKNDYPSLEALTAAADRLGCDVAAIQAVASVECGPEGAFFPSGAPVILFEAHRFHALTRGKHDGVRAPGIAGDAGALSRPTWKPGSYGPNSIQHLRLSAAVALDRDAAIMATSWGLFQIMGGDWQRCGYASLQSFVNAAYRSADDHLEMFVHFIRADARLVKAIREHDWATFARIYNGPAYAKNQYDTRLAAAYSRSLNAAL